VTYKSKIFLAIFIIILTYLPLKAGAFVELSSGYSLPFGEWNKVFGKGFCFGGMAGFSFSEYLNPGLGGLLIFPRTGESIEEEYKSIHNTESISLFTATGFIYLENRMEFELSEKNIFTVDFGYALHSQRDYATIIYNGYECVDNFSGHGPFLGIGFKKSMSFSVFDYIHPFLKFYYSSNKVYYYIVDNHSSIVNFDVAERRLGFFMGITFISIGEE